MSRLERWSRIKRGLEPDDQPSASDPKTKDRSESPLPPNEPDPANGAGSAQNHEADDTQSSESSRPVPPPPGSLDETLPDPETLEAGSDFSGYMEPGVSSALRRRALKRLWSTGNYNVRDGLDDYDLDYRNLLKPMAPELAGKLRRWSRKIDEAIAQDDQEIPESGCVPSSKDDNEAQPAELGEAPRTAAAGEQETSLDDQSSSPKTKA